ncbi:hypothetical protein DCO58_01550 [Helicobacter saguini]|uniref:Uncharacterized protein n=1 Tax=Helicobacter saguini TaxID=1548018 RepID=A0A099B5T2_9HELI|nr:hypothetical protein [Helicobacter saguini]MWV62933.1 hypothetical protein [Helicobacter saguini]MWV66397.1 hypothetical protein [Helicobacter saguini]MWV68749.1 hypothetical protein [Helicobacter saguini]MWV71698.1 hypothetical protein [Helicobacter saguini]TLD91879.1 hypothetical protein LS64_011190 [Helicobacter saguini]
MSHYTKKQILKLLKYTKLAWASYSTKLNSGMFGENDKKWGLNKKNKKNQFSALYTCKSFAICSKDNKSLIDKNNTEKILGYKSVFANIFILNKDSITNECLESRKALYKSFMFLKQEIT